MTDDEREKHGRPPKKPLTPKKSRVGAYVMMALRAVLTHDKDADCLAAQIAGQVESNGLMPSYAVVHLFGMGTVVTHRCKVRKLNSQTWEVVYTSAADLSQQEITVFLEK